jgi:putative regulator of septum formation
MTVPLDASKRFDHVPTNHDWDAFFDRDCRPSAESLIGGPIDPDGRFGPSGLTPTAESWENGFHIVWCGVAFLPISAPLPGRNHTPFTGKVDGAPQARIAPVGSCWTSDSPYAVSCKKPHEYEISGYVDLTGRVAQPPAPSDTAAWQPLVNDDCSRVARSYLGHDLVDDQGWSWEPIQPGSWAAGRRTVECSVGRFRNDKAISTIGSLRA